MRRAGIAVSVVAAGLLAPTSAAAYRTAGDLPAFTGTARVRWRTDRVPVRMSDTGTPGVQVLDVERALRASLDAWRAPTCSTFAPVYGGITATRVRIGDGMNEVHWLRGGWAARGFPPSAAATTDLLYERDASGEWRLAEGDVYLNAIDSRWGVPGGAAGSARRDVQAVLTHEFGHLFGLLHPCALTAIEGAPLCSTDPGFATTTMYPLYAGPGQAILDPDSEAGLCFLYPASSCMDAGCALGQLCTSRGCVPDCGGVACAAGQVCQRGSCLQPACGAPTCPTRTMCATAAECPAGERCFRRTCVADGGPLGDPCANAEDCQTRDCAPGGYCSLACRGRAGCPTGYGCSATGGVCEPEAGVFGEGCLLGSDCVTGLCLDRSGAATCTRECTTDGPPCPGSTMCGAVEGRDVCHPPLMQGGCTVGPIGPRGPGQAPWVLLAAAWIFLCRRRRR